MSTPRPSGDVDVRKIPALSSDYERLLISPRRACHLLDCGITRLYQLLNTGELESFLDGRSRKIIVESIRRYIDKRLSTAKERSAVPRRHGRRRTRKDIDVAVSS
jgi:hypothetical protein